MEPREVRAGPARVALAGGEEAPGAGGVFQPERATPAGGARAMEEELPRRYFVVLHESYGPYGAGIVYRHSFYTEQEARSYINALIEYFEELGLGKWRKDKRVVDKFNGEADITETYALDAWRGRDLDGPAKIILCKVVDDD